MKIFIKKIIIISILIICLCTTLIGCTRENVAVRSSFVLNEKFLTHNGLYCDYSIFDSNDKEIKNTEIRLYLGHNDTWLDDYPEKRLTNKMLFGDPQLYDDMIFVAVAVYFQYFAPEEVDVMYKRRGFVLNNERDEEGQIILAENYVDIDNAVFMKGYTREEFNSEKYLAKSSRGIMSMGVKYSHYETFIIPPSLLSHYKGFVEISIHGVYQTVSDGKFLSLGCCRRVLKYSAINSTTVKLSNVKGFYDSELEFD